MLTNLIVANLLESCARRIREGTDDAEAIAEVFTLLSGGTRSNATPVHENLVVKAWCVVKQDERNTHADLPWPGQAYGSAATAEEWRLFLEDYYYDTHVRDGKVRWVVKHMECSARYYARGLSKNFVGQGYTHDRNGWVGTLPMRLYVWDDSGPLPGRWRKRQDA